MKEYKRSLANFAFYDSITITQKLEQMAMEGWMLKETGNFFWTYEKVPPQHLHFAVTYCANASEFDSSPTDAQLTKEEFCAFDGWHLLKRWHTMQIFYTEEEHAIPIETDPVTQIETIHKAVGRKILLPQCFALFIWFGFLLSKIWNLWTNTTDVLSSSYDLYIIPVFLFIVLAFAHELISYFFWHHKAYQIAQNEGTFYRVKNRSWISYTFLIFALIFLFLSYCSSPYQFILFTSWIFVAVSITLGTKKLLPILKKKNLSRRTNQMICVLCVWFVMFFGIVGLSALAIHQNWFTSSHSIPVDSYEFDGRTRNIYDDTLPLNIEDLVETDTHYSKQAEYQETFLLSCAQFSQRPLLTETVQTYRLDYTIYDIKQPILYPLVKDGLLRARQDEVQDDMILTDHYEPIDPSAWNANEVYQLHWSDSVLNTYLICFDHHIVEIQFFWQPTTEQIQTAASILANE